MIDWKKVLYSLEGAAVFVLPLLIDRLMTMIEGGAVDWKRLGLFCLASIGVWLRRQFPAPAAWDGTDRRALSKN
jgi:hypothetical protein